MDKIDDVTEIKVYSSIDGKGLPCSLGFGLGRVSYSFKQLADIINFELKYFRSNFLAESDGREGNPTSRWQCSMYWKFAGGCVWSHKRRRSTQGTPHLSPKVTGISFSNCYFCIY